MKPKYFKRLIFTIIFLIIEVSAGFLLYHRKCVHADQYLDKKSTEVNIAYASAISNYAAISQTIFSEIINRPAITALMAATRQADSTELAAIRSELYEMLYASSRNLYQTNLINLHFQLYDCRSFLRFYNAEKFGDDLSQRRLSIKTVHDTKIMVQGFEIGSFYQGYRYIYPLFADTEYVGSVEIGISSRSITTKMKEIFGQYFTFMFDRQMITGSIFSEEAISYHSSDIDTSYLIEKQNGITSAQIKEFSIFDGDIAAADNSLRKLFKKYRDTTGAFALPAHATKKSLIVTFVPVSNFRNHHVAFLVGYFADDTVAHYRSDFIEKLLLFSILLLLVFLLMYYINHSVGMIRNSRDQLQSITDNMNEGLIMLDIKRKILHINPAAEKTLGYYCHNLIGRELTKVLYYRNEDGKILAPEHWPDFDVIDIGLVYKSKKGFFILRNRAEIPIELSASPRYMKTQKVGYLIVFREILTR